MPEFDAIRRDLYTKSEIEVISNVSNISPLNDDFDAILEKLYADKTLEKPKKLKASVDLTFNAQDPDAKAFFVVNLHATSGDSVTEKEDQEKELLAIKSGLDGLRQMIQEKYNIKVNDYLVMGDTNQNLLNLPKDANSFATVNEEVVKDIATKLGKPGSCQEIAFPKGLMSKYRGVQGEHYNGYMNPQVSKDKKLVENDSKDGIFRFQFEPTTSTNIETLIKTQNEKMGATKMPVTDVITEDTNFRDHYGTDQMKFQGITFGVDSLIPTAGMKAISEPSEYFIESILGDGGKEAYKKISEAQIKSSQKLIECICKRIGIDVNQETTIGGKKVTPLKTMSTNAEVLSALNLINIGFRNTVNPQLANLTEDALKQAAKESSQNLELKVKAVKAAEKNLSDAKQNKEDTKPLEAALKDAKAEQLKALQQEPLYQALMGSITDWVATKEYGIVLNFLRSDGKNSKKAVVEQKVQELLEGKDNALMGRIIDFISEKNLTAAPEKLTDLANRFIQSCFQSQSQQMNAGYFQLNAKSFPGPRAIDKAHAKTTKVMVSEAMIASETGLVYIANTEAGGQNKTEYFHKKMLKVPMKLMIDDLIQTKTPSQLDTLSNKPKEKKFLGDLKGVLKTYKDRVVQLEFDIQKKEVKDETQFNVRIKQIEENLTLIFLCVDAEKPKCSEKMQHALNALESKLMVHFEALKQPSYSLVNKSLDKEFFKTSQETISERTQQIDKAWEKIRQENKDLHSGLMKVFNSAKNLSSYSEGKDKDMTKEQKSACHTVGNDIQYRVSQFIIDYVKTAKKEDKVNLINGLKNKLIITAHSKDSIMTQHRNYNYLLAEVITGILSIGALHLVHYLTTGKAGLFSDTNRSKKVEDITESIEQIKSPNR